MIGFKKNNRGFALIVAVILSGVAAAVTVTLTTLAYKSLVLSSTAKESQYAFYAADSALECALFWDNGSDKPNGIQGSAFKYAASPSPVTIHCPVTIDSATEITLVGSSPDSETSEYRSGWFSVNDARCAQIIVYKGNSSNPTTKLYANGVNKSCAEFSASTNSSRTVERGLKASY
jgi:hypothetical protein